LEEKQMKKVVVSLALALGTLAAAVTLGSNYGFADALPADSLKISNISYGGTGCPAESARVEIAPDQKAFTVIFDQFVAQLGPGIPLTESRKNCQVNVGLHVPNGFTYAITSIDYRGYANLAPGAQGMQKSSYYFQGQMPTASAWTTFNGSYDQDWQIRDTVETAALVWAPCGVERALNINAQLQIKKGTSTGQSFMQMDSEDGSIHQVYHLEFRRCPNP
jgi:Domain of unknown function (DUF4360)